MTNSQLNFAGTGSSAFVAEFASSCGPNELERLVLEDFELSAKLTATAASPNDAVVVFSSYSPQQDTHPSLSFTYSPAKRTLDLALASIGLFILSPFLLIIALLIKAETPDRQSLNNGGEVFTDVHFRSGNSARCAYRRTVRP